MAPAAVVLSATFIYAFDFNVVNVALPRSSATCTPARGLELAVGGYAFTYAAGLVTGGRLGDLFGYRRMFLSGLAAFTVASIAVRPVHLTGPARRRPPGPGPDRGGHGAPGAGPHHGHLSSGRTDPGLGLVRGHRSYQRGDGQVLGGLILDANVAGLSWRAIFFVNLPVGAIVLAFGRRILPRLAVDQAAPRST